MDGDEDNGLSRWQIHCVMESPSAESGVAELGSSTSLTGSVSQVFEDQNSKIERGRPGEMKICKIIDEHEHIIDQILVEDASESNENERLQKQLLASEVKCSSLIETNSQIILETNELREIIHRDKEVIRELLEDRSNLEMKLRAAKISEMQFKNGYLENEKYIAELHKRESAASQQMEEMKKCQKRLEEENRKLAEKIASAEIKTTQQAQQIDEACRKFENVKEKLKQREELISGMNNKHNNMLHSIADVLKNIYGKCKPRFRWPFSRTKAARGNVLQVHVGSLIEDVHGLLQIDITKQTCKFSVEDSK